MRRWRAISLDPVVITSPFWVDRIDVIRTASLPAMYEQMKETGRWDCLKLEWKPGQPNKPHQFWDSDIAKWVEAACYVLKSHSDTQLSQLVEEAVTMIRGAQREDGYINTYFSVVEPGKRWTNIAWMHEMYCAGHLLEAGLAHHEYTGSYRLLGPLMKYMKHINATFGVEDGKKKAYPGHEELELALVKAYETTGDESLLKLSSYFISERGQRRPEGHYYDVEAKARKEAPRPGPGRGPPYSYHQADKPIQEIESVEGHAVRAMYWLTGAAGVARHTEDEGLFEAIYRLWRSTTERKMYITGGLGAIPAWEGFGPDYYLPNETGYLETCAAVALVLFAHQMLLIDPQRAEYANVMELALYNAVLVGVALDGKTFFYENPLATIGKYYGRSTWFDCSCCPANAARLVASLGKYIYSVDEEDTIYVHLYISSTSTLRLSSGTTVTINQISSGPWHGGASFTVQSENFGGNVNVCLRVPPRSTGFSVSVASTADGRDRGSILSSSKGLVTLALSSAQSSFTAIFTFGAVRISPHPMDLENRNCVAIARGPFIYCAETIDNKDINDLRAIRIPADAEFEETVIEAPTATGQGIWKDAVMLRTRVSLEASSVEEESIIKHEVDLTLVPYFMWANRGKSDLRVWLPVV